MIMKDEMQAELILNVCHVIWETRTREQEESSQIGVINGIISLSLSLYLSLCSSRSLALSLSLSLSHSLTLSLSHSLSLSFALFRSLILKVSHSRSLHPQKQAATVKRSNLPHEISTRGVLRPQIWYFHVTPKTTFRQGGFHSLVLWSAVNRCGEL